MVDEQKVNVNISFPTYINDDYIGTVGIRSEEDGSIKPFVTPADRVMWAVIIGADGSVRTVRIHE